MHLKITFTPKATTLLQMIVAEHQTLVLLLDDTSCCSNSNVMLRENEPSWPASFLAEIHGVRVIVNPIIERTLTDAKEIVIDALDFADDSLSLETDYGKRFIMSVDPALKQLFPS